MAEYSFEQTQADSEASHLDIDVIPYKGIERFITRLGSHDGVIYKERAHATLTIADMTEIETEAVKRGIFTPRIIETSRYVPIRPSSIDYGAQKQVAKLTEIASGRFTSRASLERDGKVRLTRKNTISPDSELYDPHIYSFGSNMFSVRDLALLGIKEEYRKDGQANESHFVEIATTADRMSEEILEVVKPGLVAVHGLTMATIADRLAEHFTPVNA